MIPDPTVRTIVLISADAEWRAVVEILGAGGIQRSPFGGWFVHNLHAGGDVLLFFQGGWGKIAAAASTQYVIDRWKPELLVNLGTCGGFDGHVERGEILLVERTLVYDIIEQMGERDAHIAHYTTDMDLSWLKPDYPQPVRRSLLVSADRDLLPQDIVTLAQQYGAVAGDWESGAIAWVARRNNQRCLILRGITDLVSPQGGEAYGDLSFYQQAARSTMRRLLESLPGWLSAAGM